MADQGNEGLLSPYLRKKRFKAVMPYLNGNVLDFGCGAGGLAQYIVKTNYLGVEVDNDSLNLAKQNHPKHIFSSVLPEPDEKFDTIVSLAVIEHVSDPSRFLSDLAVHLKDHNSKLIVTTPHPAVDWVHDLGASVGLFSKHANEEHEELLDKQKLEQAGQSANLKMTMYKRFLLKANQIAIFMHK